MMRGKIIKKRTKHREVLLRNLRKGKARLEPRTGYEVIPFPLKYASFQLIHHLYADLVLMEHHGTLVIEASLINNVKVYKHVQTLDYSKQKLVRIFLENKGNPPTNCEIIAEKFANSESSEIRSWADPVKSYCRRYEALLQVDLIALSQTNFLKKLKAKKEEVSNNILQTYIENNNKVEQTRQNLFKTYPCYELKSELRDGQIQLTELKMNQKFLNEIGYSQDSFISHILKEGLPKMIPFEGKSGPALAKMRLENYLLDMQDGLQSSETESYLIMKSGYVKKIKFRHHYLSTYENGVPGFSIFGTLIAKQKPFLDFSKSQGDIKINADFIQFVAEKEKLADNFLSLYYGQKVEQKYVNIDKVCKIRELEN